MTYFTHIRAGLISSVLLLTTALASPALAETLPEISPRQIASDVEVKFNPQSGAREYVAPSFDPFEEDRSMAGTASLRSVNSAVTIDGQSVRGGALLDMTFYYNSASNDPYDTRGYDEAVYLSGEYAPVTLRDNRILECNEQVQDVVYYHEDYYRPSLYVNLFRPYRHYSGHHRYDRFRDRGYGYGRGYRGHRGYRTRGHGRIRHHDRDRSRSRGGFADRAIDRVREENGLPPRTRSDRNRRNDRQDRGRQTRDRGGFADRAADRVRTENEGARNERAATGRRMDRTPAARDANRTRNRANRTETRRGGRDGFIGGPRRLENSGDRRETRAARRATRNATPRTAPPRRERAPRATPAPRVAAPAPAPRAEPAPRAQRAERSAPAPRPRRAERAAPARPSRAVNRAAQRIKSQNSPRGRSGARRGTKLKLMSVLPMASSWSRNVVRNVDVQCAREEMLTVHIPQERLDAARFDGLTVLVLDRAGQEVPVYVPPNYIEGFRQAVSGQAGVGLAAPNVSYQEPSGRAPISRGPVYQEPRPYTIESAPCPIGTSKQADGTCLQGGSPSYGGYPTR